MTGIGMMTTKTKPSILDFKSNVFMQSARVERPNYSWLDEDKGRSRYVQVCWLYCRETNQIFGYDKLAGETVLKYPVALLKMAEMYSTSISFPLELLYTNYNPACSL